MIWWILGGICIIIGGYFIFKKIRSIYGEAKYGKNKY
jgi:hypothetical protein